MKKIGLLGLSNPCDQKRVDQVTSFLESINTKVIVSDILTEKSTPQERSKTMEEKISALLSDVKIKISLRDIKNVEQVQLTETKRR